MVLMRHRIYACLRPAGFTLVELLVAVAIVVLLISLLLPSLSRARRQSRAVVCTSNLRQLGIAFQMYVNHNKGKSFFVYGSDENYWPYVLEPQIGAVKAALLCPEAPQHSGVPTHQENGVAGSPRRGTAFHAWAQISSRPGAVPGRAWDEMESSYGMNGWLSALRPSGSIPAGDAARDKYISLPAEEAWGIPLFADCTAHLSYPYHTDAPPRNLSVPIPPTGNLGPDVCGMHAFCIARHGRAINVVFLDGHARRVPLEELWRLKWNRHFQPTTVTLPPE